MNITTLLITIFIFLDNLGYAIFEFKNSNILGGLSIIILNIAMLIVTNYFMYNFR